MQKPIGSFVSDIKVDYLYHTIDKDINEIIVIDNGEYSFRAKSIQNFSNNEDDGRYWNTSNKIISEVPHTSDLFNDSTSVAFYEIGKMNKYPEYFL